MQTGKFANLIGRNGPILVMAAGVVCLLFAQEPLIDSSQER